jgi:hypothetical protein
VAVAYNQKSSGGEQMARLKLLCFFFSIVLLAVALTGINAVSGTASGITVSHLDASGRIWAVVDALIAAIFAYGIHSRARIAWRAGFIVWVLSYVYFVFGAVSGTYRAAHVISFSSFWLPTGLAVFIGAAVTIYWGSWWKRQRSYFL